MPYFSWFVYMAFAIIYFLFVCKESAESKRFIYSIGTGITVFLVVSYIYPNGHHLRVETIGNNIFMIAVRFLHWIDTPTNVLPSMHVFVTIALIIVFLYVYQQNVHQKSLYLGIILIASGISDVLDGYIARKYNMITELGKCLDPIADKLTQFVLLICLLVKYPMAKITLTIFVVKEIIVTVMGYKVINMQGKMKVQNGMVN